MCVKPFFRDLNFSCCPPHPIRTYTYEVITALRVRNGLYNFYNLM